MDVSARISKWIVQLQEFDYTVMVEESTRAALAGILTHQFKEKKENKELKNSPPPAPPPNNQGNRTSDAGFSHHKKEHLREAPLWIMYIACE